MKWKGGLVAVMTAALMLCAVVLPATNVSAATNLTPGGLVDLDKEDADNGIHNSYAWCGAVFTQDDGNDYLWVGTNRDLGGTVISAAVGAMGLPAHLVSSYIAMICDATDIPVPSDDKAGKIYRLALDDMGEEIWELMWEDDAINGYRKMMIFNDDLYVFAGLTNPGYDYSLVYRFSPDFAYGDTPDIVLWDISIPASLPGGASELFRSSAILDDILYVGTFDGKIYSTDGSGLQSLTPNDGDGTVGWELFIDLFDTDDITPGGIWDLLSFNGYLYAFVGTGADGFRVYKFDNGDLVQIVGDGDAPYSPGMGIDKHVAASPFVLTVDGQEYVYVTTFANGPAFLAFLVGDVMKLLNGTFDGWSVFENYWAPAVMYRFDADDTWETIVGDNGPLGNQRAGFYQGMNPINPSSNQYIWWMAEQDGKIYASTWDTGVFREPLRFVLNEVFTGVYGAAERAALDAAILEFQLSFMKVTENMTEREYMDLLPNIMGHLENAMAEYQDRGSAFAAFILQDLADNIIAEIEAAVGSVVMSVSDALRLSAALANLFILVNGTSSELMSATVAVVGVMFMTPIFGFFMLDSSNPAGFDLYVSDDGVNFSPVTLDGFGDPYNYGGRVLIPSEYGLFVFTANPFTGTQVWLLEKWNPAVTMASNVWIKGSEDHFVFSVAHDAGDFLRLHFNGEELELGVHYSVEPGSTVITIFTDHLESLDAGDHDIDIVYGSGTVSTKMTVSLGDTAGGDGGLDTNTAAAVILAVMIGFGVVYLLFIRKP